MVKVNNNAKRSTGNSVVVSRQKPLTSSSPRPSPAHAAASSLPQQTWSEWFWEQPNVVTTYEHAARVGGWTWRGLKVTGRAAAIVAGTAIVFGIPLWLLLETDANQELIALHQATRLMESSKASSAALGGLSDAALGQVSQATDLILFK